MKWMIVGEPETKNETILEDGFVTRYAAIRFMSNNYSETETEVVKDLR